MARCEVLIEVATINLILLDVNVKFTITILIEGKVCGMSIQKYYLIFSCGCCALLMHIRGLMLGWNIVHKRFYFYNVLDWQYVLVREKEGNSATPDNCLKSIV